MLRRIQDFFRRGPAVAVVEVIQPQPANNNNNNNSNPPTQSKCSLCYIFWFIIAGVVAVVTGVVNAIVMFFGVFALLLWLIFKYILCRCCCLDSEALRKIEESKSRLQERKMRMRNILEYDYLRNNTFMRPPISLTASNERIKADLARITDLSFEELRGALQTGTYNAYTVIVAYMRKALEIDEELNCITDVMHNALSDAISLDTNQGKNRDQFPLYGIPFSVKSVFDIANLENNIGLTKRSGVGKEHTSSLVTHLRNLGAIPFCTTNVPQGLLAFVTANPIYGITKNPWDYTRTPGGSSGGEGALIAAGGAPFGIGNDLVGSLRIPAAFCGLVSLKPSEARLRATHSYCGPENRGLVGASNGFITKKVEDQQYLLSLVIDNPGYLNLLEPAHRPQTPAPLDANFQLPPPIRIGYMLDDGFNSACPSNHRAIEDTIVKLKKEKRYELVPFRIQDIEINETANTDNQIDVPNNNNNNDNVPKYDVYKVADMLFKNVLKDNGASMRELYNNEPWHSCLRVFILFIWLKSVLHRWLFWLLACFIPSKVLKRVARATNRDANEENATATQTFRRSWERYWTGLNISALICPSIISPAPPHYYPQFLTAGVFSTGLYNMLDCPAGIVPVSHVTAEDVKRMSDYPEKYEEDLSLWLQRESAYESVGLPNAVQVVTLPGQEDTCLEVMRDVQDVSEGCVLNLKFPRNAADEDEVPNPPLTGDSEALQNFEESRTEILNDWYGPPAAPEVSGPSVKHRFFSINASMWSWYLYATGIIENRKPVCCCCCCPPIPECKDKFRRVRAT